MAKIVHTLIAAAVASASTLVPLSQGYAHDRRFEHYHGAGPGWDGPRKPHRKHYRHRPEGKVKNNDDALLLGVLGLAAGAIVAGALLSEPGPRPEPRYVEPGPDPYDDYGRPGGWAGSDYYPPAPAEDYAASGTIEPWTQDWYRYCSQRYRSFKPATGTFRGYDGQDHFCVAR